MKRTAPALVTALLSVIALIMAAPAASAGTAGAPPAASSAPATTSSTPPTTSSTSAAASSAPAAASTDRQALDEQTMGGGASTAGTTAAKTVGPLRTSTPSVNTKGGNMFDTCNTPSVSDMTAWLASPYRTVGVYVGGIARACATQPNLTPSWVSTVTGMGWNLVPIYVGLQAPCTAYTKAISLSESTAAGQGAAAALDAVVQMKALGIGQNVPVYYDMEAYDSTNGPCSVSVRAFTKAWTETLHSRGYLSGLYGSASSMIEQAEAWTAAGGYAAPDKVWVAAWNGMPDGFMLYDRVTAQYDIPVFTDPSAWAGNRIHQFAGGHYETWGGVTINVDSNYVQALSAAPSYVNGLNPRVVWDSQTARVGTNPVALAVGGVAGVPRDATAAVLNFQVIDPSADASLIVMPYQSSTNTPAQTFQKGKGISTTVVVPLTAMNVQFRLTAGTARVVVSAEGYLSTTTGNAMTALSPTIVYDSITPKITTRATALEVGGHAGIPRDASAALLSIQVVHPTAAGSLIVKPWKSGSIIGMQQFGKGQAVSATVLVPLSARNMEFRLTAGAARVIVTAVGYLAPVPPVAEGAAPAGITGQLVATSPSLAWDSRVNAVGAPWMVPGLLGVPGNAAAVLVNVQVVNPSAAGNLVVAPKGSGSTIGVQQFVRGQSISTLMLVPLIDRAIQLRVTAGNARVIVTNVGYVTD